MANKFNPDNMSIVLLGATGYAVVRRIYPLKRDPGFIGQIFIFGMPYLVKEQEGLYTVDYKKRYMPFMSFKAAKLAAQAERT